MASRPLLTALLKDVSRSFYLTMRVLPGAIRPQIGLAYLLARATDTVADTTLVPLDRRLLALRGMRDCLLGKTDQPPDFGEFAPHQAQAAEAELLNRFPEALSLLKDCAPDDRALIRHVLDTITSGQELDLTRFADAGPSRIVSLANDAELDDYTYRVAGCVGEFWTRICLAHLFRDAALDTPTLLAQGVRFGKGLQLVNILRDIPADLRQGRCYLPADRLGALGLAPADLRVASNESRFRPLYNECLARAEAHLDAGWEYTNALPRSQRRVRLACAWPVLIGLKTLRKLEVAPVLGGPRVKVTRSEVYGILARTLLLHPWPAAWK